MAALTSLSTNGVPVGMLRVTLDTQVPYLWNGSSWLPLNAGAWVEVIENADCSLYPTGTLGRDLADNLLMCAKANGQWKKVSP